MFWPYVHFNKIQLFEFLFIKPAASCAQDFPCLSLGQLTELLGEESAAVSCAGPWGTPAPARNLQRETGLGEKVSWRGGCGSQRQKSQGPAVCYACGGETQFQQRGRA